MEEINLGGEPINRCDILIFDKVIQVKIWMTEDEYFDAFQKGGPSYEREVLMGLRKRLFPTSDSNMKMFYDENDCKEFKMNYLDIKDGWFNSTFFIINGNKQQIIDYIKKQFMENFSSQKNSNLTQEFTDILNFSNYYSAGTMDYGIDGPEIDMNNLYISIFHYLQYTGEDPHNYDTYNLGNYLTSRSADYKTCKYKSQSFDVNKFNLDLLRIEKNNFQSYKKVKNLVQTSKPTFKTNSYSGNFKSCPQCGAMHNASFARCAVCNDFSASNDPDWY